MIGAAPAALGPPWTIQRLTGLPDGSVQVQVRARGGRTVRVVVPAGQVSYRGMVDAIEVALAHLPRPPGPNT